MTTYFTGWIKGSWVWVWMDSEFWQYLFAKKDAATPWRTVLVCRLRNHPDGPVHYNIGGTEPDWHCKNCRDLIG